MTTDLEQSNASPEKEILTELENHTLEMLKIKQALARTSAEKALAQNEVAELMYNNFILRITLKYNLHEKDLITEQGEIVRVSTGSNV